MLHRKPGRARSLLPKLIVALLLWPLVAWAGARLLIVKAELPNADAIVILSGSSTYIERADYAAQLYAEGRAPRVILTNDNIKGGWSVEEQRNPFFYERAARELREHGVPADKIEVVMPVATSTYEESWRLRDYASEHKLGALLVVTSPYHARRALWTLRRVFDGTGVQIGLDTPAPGQQSPSAATWWCYPSGWKMVPGEYLKMLYYLANY